MKYGIAIFPSKELQDIANSLRKRYDPNYALVPPHITLKKPFDLEDDETPDTVSQIRDIAKELSPLIIHVNRVGSFHPLNNVIYLKIKESQELTLLHERLNTNTLQREEPYNFVPHITIAQKLSNAEHADVLGRLKMENFNHEEVVDRFQLMYQLENHSWTVFETFHLD